MNRLELLHKTALFEVPGWPDTSGFGIASLAGDYIEIRDSEVNRFPKMEGVCIRGSFSSLGSGIMRSVLTERFKEAVGKGLAEFWGTRVGALSGRRATFREGIKGTVIGPYKLLEQIGVGSFGVVFLAEQTQPVRRKVALKIPKPGKLVAIREELVAFPKRIGHIQKIIDRIVVGNTVYPLRSTLHVSEHFSSTGFEIRVQDLSPAFVGHGSTMVEAWTDWQEQIHIAFQELYGKRPFEMTSEQQTKWSLLEKMIDIEAYEIQMPQVLNQIGRLRSARPDPYQIEWFNGSVELVSLADMPAEFVRFKPGQWFEATVERDRGTLRLRKVLSIRAREPLVPMSEQELASFIARLPKSEGSVKPIKDWANR